ncbi:MAG: hypothetical protein ACM3ME_02590 [Chloroflexota bacterium]|nr:hypothetical protein [Lentimicrobium sp.]
MKRFIAFLIIVSSLLYLSCSNTARFTVTDAAPAAEIKAKTRVDEDNNKVLTINAKNLEMPQTIDSSSNAYVVWIKTDAEELFNIGQLVSKEDETASLKALTPYEFKEIIITAESRANVSEPSGTEIAKVDIPDYMVAPVPEAPANEPYQGDTSGTINQGGIPNPYDTLQQQQY